MICFDNKYFKCFRFCRLIFYIILFLVFIIIPTSYFINDPVTCFFKHHYGVLCPTCGVTRAFSCMMHFNYNDAFNYNPVFTVAFGPIFIFLFMQDLVNIVINLLKKDYKKYSIMEYIVFEYLWI